MAAGTLPRVFVLSAAAALSACASDSASHAPTPPSSEHPSMTTYTGVLRSGYSAIGGETTGWMLEGADLSCPIEADVSKVADIARAWEGQRVRVTGRITTRKYVERGEVSIIVVERIDPVM